MTVVRQDRPDKLRAVFGVAVEEGGPVADAVETEVVPPLGRQIVTAGQLRAYALLADPQFHDATSAAGLRAISTATGKTLWRVRGADG
ncbi:hypothetical protein GCM10010435_26770 [Winogradskya consettensis]|uniref:Uncharacterized protein n=1 Tax=Winogradskya consettensis TaxID=113560 RepID=A0A919S974_9ACTN|nr:hypothetical protein Aco04nite_09560 [Actinoplanes consettensis]